MTFQSSYPPVPQGSKFVALGTRNVSFASRQRFPHLFSDSVKDLLLLAMNSVRVDSAVSGAVVVGVVGAVLVVVVFVLEVALRPSTRFCHSPAYPRCVPRYETANCPRTSSVTAAARTRNTLMMFCCLWDLLLSDDLMRAGGTLLTRPLMSDCGPDEEEL